MSKPTLFQKGKVVPKKWMSTSQKNKLQNQEAIEFIMDHIKDRIPLKRGLPPKVKIKKPGDLVLLLKSGTGSGKSTTIAPQLFLNYFQTDRRNIAITQPRVLTAVDIPQDIVKYYDDLRMEDNIGYQTGVISKKPIKGIIFMTVGVLVQQLKTMEPEHFLKKYSFILIDEVHERSIDVDLALYHMKTFLEKYYKEPGCPMLILMSATFEPKKFMNYFNVPKENVIEVSGRTYPIEKNYSKYDVSNDIYYAFDVVERLHIENLENDLKLTDKEKNSEDMRDILIFVQGGKEIKALIEMLEEFNRLILDKKNLKELKDYIKGKPPLEEVAKIDPNKKGGKEKPERFYIAPVALNSQNFKKGGKEYQDLFANINHLRIPIKEFDAKTKQHKIIKYVKPVRRVIVATNIAETGVTIDTLKYCVDTGFVKMAEFNPEYSSDVLTDQPITKGMADQRAGRVGRKAPGIWYGCYTKDTYNQMQEDQYPQIITSEITENLLSSIILETEAKLLDYKPSEIPIFKNKVNKSSKEKKEIDYFKIHIGEQRLYDFVIPKKFNIASLDFMEFPSISSINYSLEKLHTLGFIDDEQSPTYFGYIADKIRKIPLESIRMIIAGYQNKANVLDLITIASCLMVGWRSIGPFRNKYKPRNPFNVSEEEALSYYRYFVGDEFIEYIFIWNDFMKSIDKMGESARRKSKKKLSVNFIKNWCKENGFRYRGLLRVIETRDEIIENLILLGINPYYNGLGLRRGTYNLTEIVRRNKKEGLEEIKKIKKCIYEGYRLNLSTWNPIIKKYVLDFKQIPLTIKDSVLIKPVSASEEEIEQERPMKIIVSGIIIMPKPFDSNMYEYSVKDSISILDSFINIDEGFLFA